MKDSEYTLAQMNGEQVTVTRKPVEFTIVSPGNSILPEGEPETLLVTS
jgi:fumarate reductase flavoprotein subunit